VTVLVVGGNVVVAVVVVAVVVVVEGDRVVEVLDRGLTKAGGFDAEGAVPALLQAASTAGDNANTNAVNA
jgi:hypothetical protein